LKPSIQGVTYVEIEFGRLRKMVDEMRKSLQLIAHEMQSDDTDAPADFRLKVCGDLALKALARVALLDSYAPKEQKP
jgi:DNA-directed RNA polymerase beta subunit